MPCLLGMAGMALATSINAAILFTDDFDGIAVPASPGFLYGDSGGWTMTTDTASWWYDTNYATVTSAGRPDPTGGTGNALSVRGEYAQHAVGATFLAGQTYRLTMDLSTANGGSGTRVFAYIGDQSLALADATAVGRLAFHDDGTTASAVAASNIVSANYQSVTDAGNWTTVSYEYTATGADDGKDIGIAFWASGAPYMDNVQFESVPEPSSTALLGLGGLALILRRRK